MIIGPPENGSDNAPTAYRGILARSVVAGAVLAGMVFLLPVGCPRDPQVAGSAASGAGQPSTPTGASAPVTPPAQPQVTRPFVPEQVRSTVSIHRQSTSHVLWAIYPDAPARSVAAVNLKFYRYNLSPTGDRLLLGLDWHIEGVGCCDYPGIAYLYDFNTDLLTELDRDLDMLDDYVWMTDGSLIHDTACRGQSKDPGQLLLLPPHGSLGPGWLDGPVAFGSGVWSDWIVLNEVGLDRWPEQDPLVSADCSTVAGFVDGRLLVVDLGRGERRTLEAAYPRPLLSSVSDTKSIKAALSPSGMYLVGGDFSSANDSYSVWVVNTLSGTKWTVAEEVSAYRQSDGFARWVDDLHLFIPRLGLVDLMGNLIEPAAVTPPPSAEAEALTRLTYPSVAGLVLVYDLDPEGSGTSSRTSVVSPTGRELWSAEEGLSPWSWSPDGLRLFVGSSLLKFDTTLEGAPTEVGIHLDGWLDPLGWASDGGFLIIQQLKSN